MDTENTNGVDLQPRPQNADKYAEYMELNPEDGKAEGTADHETGSKSTEPTADVKPVVEPSTTTKQESEHIPNWRKKIGKQTAQIKTLRAELEALKAKQGTNPQSQQKYTRNNFVTDEEYETYLDENLDKRVESKVTANSIQDRQAQLEALESSANSEKFRNEWAEKVQANYGDNAEDLAVLTGITSDHKFLETLPEVVHDYMESTPLAPVMMHVLYLRPDLVERIASAKPIVQAKMLWDLDNEIKDASRGNSKSMELTVKPISKAPAPIGKVVTDGSTTTSDEESDEATYNRLLKKRQQSRGR